MPGFGETQLWVCLPARQLVALFYQRPPFLWPRGTTNTVLGLLRSGTWSSAPQCIPLPSTLAPFLGLQVLSLKAPFWVHAPNS